MAIGADGLKGGFDERLILTTRCPEVVLRACRQSLSDSCLLDYGCIRLQGHDLMFCWDVTGAFFFLHYV